MKYSCFFDPVDQIFVEAGVMLVVDPDFPLLLLPVCFHGRFDLVEVAVHPDNYLFMVVTFFEGLNKGLYDLELPWPSTRQLYAPLVFVFQVEGDLSYVYRTFQWQATVGNSAITEHIG